MSTSDVPTRRLEQPPEDMFAVFLRTLYSADLLREADVEAILQNTLDGRLSDWKVQAIDTLQAYYTHDRGRRTEEDGFFLLDARQPLRTNDLIAIIADRMPALAEMHLEYIGSNLDPTYVLRLREHRGPVIDEDEDDARTGYVTARGIVAASNTLLDCLGIRKRFVPLRMDATREAFVTTTINNALNLCQADCLEESEIEALLSFTQW